MGGGERLIHAELNYWLMVRGVILKIDIHTTTLDRDESFFKKKKKKVSSREEEEEIVKKHNTVTSYWKKKIFPIFIGDEMIFFFLTKMCRFFLLFFDKWRHSIFPIVKKDKKFFPFFLPKNVK